MHIKFILEFNVGLSCRRAFLPTFGRSTAIQSLRDRL